MSYLSVGPKSLKFLVDICADVRDDMLTEDSRCLNRGISSSLFRKQRLISDEDIEFEDEIIYL